MARTVGIGIQDFGDIIRKNCFYIDKTSFIQEWWDSEDSVTLITRPRRFGKTLNMSMMEYFFSVNHAGRGELFEGLSVWKNEKYRAIQGTYPVISLSFANVKERNYPDAKERICQLITDLYIKNHFLRDCQWMTEADREFFDSVRTNMPEVVATLAVYKLCDYLYRYYGKKVIILLDEYDTPMQEAYVSGYWTEMVSFIRSMFNSAFKTNIWLERAILTGITRVSKESIFSDLNNLEVVTTTSEKYAASFGFTEEEVFAALEECGFSDKKEKVKWWYDGFVFGKHEDIYNPWSILNFLDKGKIATYWANTSSNSLVGKLLREGTQRIKEQVESLLQGGRIWAVIDEQIVYDQLDHNDSAVWSLLLASGYLKVLRYDNQEMLEDGEETEYELTLTNYEVKRMFYNMVRGWFDCAQTDYNDFIKALLLDDKKAMNAYMNRVALNTFSYFDTGRKPSGEEPERFYHGFVLGLIVDLQNRYTITSNRESGFGRYDVVLEPKNPGEDHAVINNGIRNNATTNNPIKSNAIINNGIKNNAIINNGIKNNAIIMEFKVHDPEEEATLRDTVQAALKQIEDKKYETALIQRGIPTERIKKYGFAFEGKKVLIG